VEKPLAMTMRELIRAYDTVKRSDRVVRFGTQMRSYANSGGARKLIAVGELGKILKVEQVRNGYSPYWMSFGGARFLAEKPAEADVDWKAFLGDRKPRPFDATQYQGWYGFREFSRGPHTNLMVHFIDLVHYVTGVSIRRV
jgi:predicted dehydrogenase